MREELSFQETIQDALGEREFRKPKKLKAFSYSRQKLGMRAERRKRVKNVLLFLEVKFNASVFVFVCVCVCVCFCGVGRSIFLQIVFLSVGWNPSYRLLLHYSLGKGKGKTSTKTNIAPWSQVESLPLRERSSRPGASFPRQSLAYSIVSLPALPSLFLKLLTN